MQTLYIVLTIVLTVLHILAASVRITPHSLSVFELRRSATKDQRAAAALEREERLSELVTTVWLVTSLLFVLVVISALLAFGWGWGLLFVGLEVLTFGALARTKLARSWSGAIWKWAEPRVLAAPSFVRTALQTLRVDTLLDAQAFRRVDSRQELEHLISQSSAVLSSHDRLLLMHGLAFADKKVDEVMTPRAAIDSIKKGEFLGPLTLSELHDLGHSRLPVIDEDLDHVVGVLHLRDLLSLDDKKSTTAQKAMEPKVFYIHQDDSLEHALAAFIRTRHHLFVVINDSRETVGLISLEDVIEALIGRKIMDEDDNHADLRAVATQRGQSNNRPSSHVDL